VNFKYNILHKEETNESNEEKKEEIEMRKQSRVCPL
jgi:hypothetical protein